MAREQRFDISTKSLNINHKLSIGCFPDEFMAKTKKWTITNKSDHIVATEEVPKVK